MNEFLGGTLILTLILTMGVITVWISGLGAVVRRKNKQVQADLDKAPKLWKDTPAPKSGKQSSKF